MKPVTNNRSVAWKYNIFPLFGSNKQGTEVMLFLNIVLRAVQDTLAGFHALDEPLVVFSILRPQYDWTKEKE